MSTLETVLLTMLSLDAIALTALVLLQQGKGADVGAAFGSGSSNTIFGASGSAPFLTKLTTWLAILFFAITFGLAYIAKERVLEASSQGIPQVNVDGYKKNIEESLDENISEGQINDKNDDSIPTL
jgi:preprotein translocase subunit SecG